MVLRLILWILAFAIAPWVVVAVMLVGLYELAIHAPGLVFALALALLLIGGWKLLTRKDTNG